MLEPFVIWFTGLSGAGKSTLAEKLRDKLISEGHKVQLLDGDELRNSVSKDLGFSKRDREIQTQRTGDLCASVMDKQAIVLVSIISPYRDARDKVRTQLERFCEVYVRCSLKELINRDTKGLYNKAKAGEITNLTGFNDPYEEPNDPEIICTTDSEMADESLEKIVSTLCRLGYYKPTNI